MPEITEDDIREIREAARQTQALSNLLLGINGDVGFCERLENFMTSTNKRVRRLEIIIGAIILAFGGGGFGIVQLVG